VVAVPGVRLLIHPLRGRSAGSAIVRRIVKLSDLPVDTPRQFAITGSRLDAWTLYPQETLGRVWLLRRGSADAAPETVRVDAYSNVCPHLGCAIHLEPGGGQFICPCHHAAFHLSGEALSDEELGETNPTPRGMDSLVCRVVQDKPDDPWWVEVEYQRFTYGLTDKVPRA
jgi:menaquinol-cytochrome c reductase iron-sulfur subunit